MGAAWFEPISFGIPVFPQPGSSGGVAWRCPALPGWGSWSLRPHPRPEPLHIRMTWRTISACVGSPAGNGCWDQPTVLEAAGHLYVEFFRCRRPPPPPRWVFGRDLWVDRVGLVVLSRPSCSIPQSGAILPRGTNDCSSPTKAPYVGSGLRKDSGPTDRRWLTAILHSSQVPLWTAEFLWFRRIVSDDKAGTVGGVERPHQRVAWICGERDDSEPRRNLVR